MKKTDPSVFASRISVGKNHAFKRNYISHHSKHAKIRCFAQRLSIMGFRA